MGKARRGSDASLQGGCPACELRALVSSQYFARAVLRLAPGLVQKAHVTTVMFCAIARVRNLELSEPAMAAALPLVKKEPTKEPKTKVKDRENSRSTSRLRLTPDEVRMINEYRESGSTENAKLRDQLKAVEAYCEGLKRRVFCVLQRVKGESVAKHWQEHQEYL